MSYQPLTQFVLSNALRPFLYFTQLTMVPDFLAYFTKTVTMEFEVLRSLFILTLLFVFYLFLRCHKLTKKKSKYK